MLENKHFDFRSKDYDANGAQIQGGIEKIKQHKVIGQMAPEIVVQMLEN